MPTFRDLLLSLHRSYFINRDEIKNIFTEFIQINQDLRTHQTMVINGPGGIGKTMLLGEFERICKGSDVPFMSISMDVCQSPVDVLIKLRNSFYPASDRNQFKKFDSIFSKFQNIEKTLLQKVKNDRKVNEVIKGVMGAVSNKGLGQIVTGFILGPVGALIASASGTLAKYSMESLINTLLKNSIISKKDAEFLSNFLPNMVSSFSHCLEYEAEKKSYIIIMLDTYEYAQKIKRLEKWITENFLSNLTQKVLIVICGRNKLEGKFWQTYSSLVRQYQLEPFKINDVSECFKTRCQSMEQADLLFQKTAGLPLGIALWVDIDKQTKTESSKTINDNIFSEVTKSVVDRFLENIDDSVIEIIRTCAIPRWFDEETIKILMPDTDASLIFVQLQNCSSIFRLRLRGLSMHEEVRKYLLSDFKFRNLMNYHELNMKIANIFKDQAEKEIRYNRQWFEYRMETTYHLLAADSEEGFILLYCIVNDALLMYDIGVLETLFSVVYDLPKEQSSYWIKYLEAVIAFLKRNYTHAKKMLLEVSEIALPKLLRAGVFHALSNTLSYLCEYRESYKYGIYSLKIYEDIRQVQSMISIYERLGWTCFRSGDFEKAVSFQKKGLSIARKFKGKADLGWAMNGLGGAYMESGNIRLSENLLKKALTIWNELEHGGGKFYSYIHLGIVYINAGLINSAISCYENASKAYKEFDDESWRVARLGQAYSLKGEFEKAQEIFIRSMKLSQDRSRYHFEAEAEWFAGDSSFIQNKYEKGIKHYAKVIEISKKIGCSFMEAKALLGLLRIYYLTNASSTKLNKMIQQIEIIGTRFKYHEILTDMYFYQSLLRLKRNNINISDLAKCVFKSLKNALMYNSHVLDKTLRKFKVYLPEINLEIADVVFEKIKSMWCSKNYMGQGVKDLEDNLRSRDKLQDSKVSVLEQLDDKKEIILKYQDIV